jgi:hypothetical protein
MGLRRRATACAWLRPAAAAGSQYSQHVSGLFVSRDPVERRPANRREVGRA